MPNTRKFFEFHLAEKKKTEISLDKKDRIQFFQFNDEKTAYIHYVDRKTVYLYYLSKGFKMLKTFICSDYQEMTCMFAIPGSLKLFAGHMSTMIEVSFSLEEEIEPVVTYSWENHSSGAGANLKVNLLLAMQFLLHMLTRKEPLRLWMRNQKMSSRYFHHCTKVIPLN
jgi:hypothetical protein